MLSIAVARSSSSTVMQSQGEGAILGVFFTIDNALYSIAFGTYTNRWTDRDAVWVNDLGGQVGPRYHLLDGGPDPPRDLAIWGKT